MTDKIYRFIQTAQRLKREGLVSDGVNKGSISCRIADDAFLISPSGSSYDSLTPETVNVMRLDGSFQRQQAPISRDSYFHLEIYNCRPDVGAIIHTHSRYATALCLAGRGIPLITYGMTIHCGGPVDIAPFALPNSEACNELIIRHLTDRRAVLLQNHGLVCVWDSLTGCYETAEFIESLSESYIHALQIGDVEEIKLGKENGYG